MLRAQVCGQRENANLDCMHRGDVLVLVVRHGFQAQVLIKLVGDICRHAVARGVCYRPWSIRQLEQRADVHFIFIFM